jgi:hypothetical protein
MIQDLAPAVFPLEKKGEGNVLDFWGVVVLSPKKESLC